MLCRDVRPAVAGRTRKGRMSKLQSVTAIAMPLLAVLAATPVKAEPAAAGSGRQMISVGGTSIPVFTYRPSGCADPSLLLVFHGAERDAEDYRDYARALADRNCMLVAAPLFAQHTFPSWRYQRGGIVDKSDQPRDPGKW